MPLDITISYSLVNQTNSILKKNVAQAYFSKIGRGKKGFLPTRSAVLFEKKRTGTKKYGLIMVICIFCTVS